MDAHRLIYMFITFGYVLVFGILGLVTLLLQVPKEKGMTSYKKAKRTLGASLLTIAFYCIIRLIFPQHHEDYVDFWLLVTFTLIHSWLTYSSLLFLLETPRFIIKRFIIDGAIPTGLMLVCGLLGVFIQQTQGIMQITFGCIFGLKCAYMFYTCLREYKKCEKELDNYYDQTPDIKWILGLICLSLIMSAVTIIAFYVTSIHLVYYLSIPIIYAYIVLKVVNFAPRKIDAIRKLNIMVDKPERAKKRNLDLDDKIGPLTEEWVEQKNYCSPNLNIKDVAMEMGTNHNYLSQYLNNSLGQTFQFWLNTLRIEESKKLLTDGSKRSIEEVGTLVGYTQTYNFSRWFRIITGTTPFQYRKNN